MPAAELKNELGLEVFEQSPCHVAVLSSSYRVVLSNAAFNETFGEPDGQLCHQLYKRSGECCEHCVAAKVFADGEVHTSDEEGLTAANTELRYHVRGIPIAGGDGSVEYVLLISTDTTRVTELEEALRAAERFAHVGLTTAGLAHTIKNILAGLDGGAYMVTTGLEKGNHDRTRAGWEMVQQYIDQVTALVKNMLSYAQPRASELESTDMGELIKDVLGLYRERAETGGIGLVVDVEKGLPKLEVNPASIHATVANMVANAIDACTWDPDLDKDHRVEVSARRCGGSVVLTISDNGAGIAEEHQPKILHAFFSTKGIRGTGLGLLLSKQVVGDHGGHIDFESTPGQGTVFKIELPVAPERGEP